MFEPDWVKNTQGGWLPLEAADLSNVTTEGVYLIWHGAYSLQDARGQNQTQLGRWVRVGQGIVKSRLEAHRLDPAILAYRRGDLYVTWAAVQAAHRDGVERYLGELLKPLVAERFPQAQPIPVRLPSAA
ncbi:MAG: hypothetical protein HY054_10275 [Proteobacteria bacterium]|nr:hypothetical protein [Pseudomonadota bacterium]